MTALGLMGLERVCVGLHRNEIRFVARFSTGPLLFNEVQLSLAMGCNGAEGRESRHLVFMAGIISGQITKLRASASIGPEH